MLTPIQYTVSEVNSEESCCIVNFLNKYKKVHAKPYLQ